MMKVKNKRRLEITIHVLLFIIVYTIPAGLLSQTTNEGYVIDQRTQWLAVITDPALIKMFIDDCYIVEDEVSRIEIMDANNNGFSKGDLIKTFPSEEIYWMDDPSDRIQIQMNKWKFQANCRLSYEHRITPNMMERRRDRKAEHSILASFIRGLNRNYKDWPLKAWIERDSKGITYEMWGYSDLMLEYTPPPPCDTVEKTIDKLITEFEESQTTPDTDIEKIVTEYKESYIEPEVLYLMIKVNPIGIDFFVETQELVRDLNMSVYNNRGRQVWSYSAKDVLADVHHVKWGEGRRKIENGPYVVFLDGNKDKVSRKFLVKR